MNSRFEQGAVVSGSSETYWIVGIREVFTYTVVYVQHIID